MERAVVLDKEPLVKRHLTDTMLLKTFALKAKGIPSKASTLQPGLKAAAEIFSPLKVFIDDSDSGGVWGLKRGRFEKAFSGASFKFLNDDRMGIPTSYTSKVKRIEGCIKRVLTSQEVELLDQAVVAANKVWGSPTITSQ